MRKIFGLFLAVSFFIAVPYVFAISSPNFPSCLNPTGTLTTVHKSGTHGVPADTTAYSGTDSLYAISQNSFIQCLCTNAGKGIQTDWWNIEGLSRTDTDTLIMQGWNYVPDGSVWGLSASPYMTKNLNYTCFNGNSGGASLSAESDGGNVLGAATNTAVGSVLGLASTGNIVFVYIIDLLAMLAMIMTILISLKRKKTFRRIFAIKMLTLAGSVLFIFACYLVWERTNPMRLSFSRLPKQISQPKADHVSSRPVSISVSRLKINLPVVEEQLKNHSWPTTSKGVAWLDSSAVPGTQGNSILYGHNWTNLLGGLVYIKPGDLVKVQYANNSFKSFTVQSTAKVSPQDTSILGSSNDRRLTIYTCTGLFDQQRFVAVATLN